MLLRAAKKIEHFIYVNKSSSHLTHRQTELIIKLGNPMNVNDVVCRSQFVTKKCYDKLKIIPLVQISANLFGTINNILIFSWYLLSTFFFHYTPLSSVTSVLSSSSSSQPFFTLFSSFIFYVFFLLSFFLFSSFFIIFILVRFSFTITS